MSENTKPVLARRPANWDQMTADEKQAFCDRILDQMGAPK